MGNELLLVGSIPLDTPQEVFEAFGAPLGKYLFAMPDGEVGPRRHWISRVHYQVLAGHPELEVVQRPAPDQNGVEQQFPRNAGDAWWFKVKDGVKEVRFGDPGWRLGYARDAINSYFVFRVMKDRGLLPSHLRFQVSIPMVNSVLPPRIFPNRDDLDRIRPGYEAATRAEIETIVEKIPAGELAIQWDCSTEVHDAYGSIPGFPLAGAIERNLTEVRNLSPHIPAEVALGYHFCFGTLGGWPRFQPDDLGQAVELANAFVTASGRPRRLDSHPGARPQRRCFLRAAGEAEAAGGSRLSGRDSQHGAVRRTHRHSPQVPAGLRPRRVLRVRPAAAFRAVGDPRRPSEGGGDCEPVGTRRLTCRGSWARFERKAVGQNESHHVQRSLPRPAATTQAISTRKIVTARLACFLNSSKPALTRVGRRKNIARTNSTIGTAAAIKAMILKIIRCRW